MFKFNVFNNLYKQSRKESNGCLKWIENSVPRNIYSYFPFFFAGDTMEHSKLYDLRGGSMASFPCCMCSTTNKFLDDDANIPNDKLTVSSKIKECWAANSTQMNFVGYSACHTNILYDLDYCNPGSLNHYLPPDILHAILLGYVIWLVHGFVRLGKKGIKNMLVFLTNTKMKWKEIC